MKVAIIGAGVSGLAAARALQAAGIDVSVFEKCPDIGGVWSATRSYPGLAAQDDRRTYAYSDTPMSGDSQRHPLGTDVRRYLEEYAADHGLTPKIRLRTEVIEATPLPTTGGWAVSSLGPDGLVTEDFDWLVAANGAFSTPHVPGWTGAEEFAAAGGRVIVPSELIDRADLAGKDVVVVGWGKTACDIAVASEPLARSTTLVARRVIWKYPKQVMGSLTFRHLLLTRLGQRVLYGQYRTPDGRVRLSRLPEWLPRLVAKKLLGRVISARLGLKDLGLVPRMTASVSTSLVTDGFFEAVHADRIVVHSDQSVEGLLDDGGRPAVRLTSGAVVPADLVVAATGFEQTLGFLAPAVRDRLVQASGHLRLHRQVLSTDVPRLAFVGWASSYHTPLTSEIAAAWLAAHLSSQVVVPPSAGRDAVVFPLTPGRAAASGLPQVPHLTLHDLDLFLRDLRAPLRARDRVVQWGSPLDPAVYSRVLADVHRRLARAAAPSEPWPGLSSPLAVTVEEFVRAAVPVHRWVLQHPQRTLAAVRAMHALPELVAAPSATIEGQAICTALSRAGALRSVVHRMTAVLALPEDVTEYTAAPGRQTLRRKMRLAEKRGITWGLVTDVDERRRLLDIADERERQHPELQYRKTSPDNRGMLSLGLWLVAYANDGRPLMLVVAPVDGRWAALRYFRTLESSDEASLARYLMSAVLIEQVAARGATYLVDPESPLKLPEGLRHFQKMLGYSLVQVRLLRPRRAAPNSGVEPAAPVDGSADLVEDAPTRRHSQRRDQRTSAR